MRTPGRVHPMLDHAAAVLLDLDGTLVDSSGPVYRTWSQFAQRHGLDADRVHEFAQGRPSRETVALLAPTADHQREAQIHEAAELADTDGITALPGARRLLDYGAPLAIVTPCSSALAAVRLSAAGLRRPNTLIGSDMVKRGKPDPEGFLLAARRLQVEPRRSLAFEDSPSGITAARSAGTRVIALRTTHSDEQLSRAHLIIDNLTSLFE